MKLQATTISVRQLPRDAANDMLKLMQAHYEGVCEPQFRADLQAKEWVILLRENGCLRGFSTQVTFNHTLAGREVRILFSGDTIIDKSCWGSLALPVAWGRLMLSLLAADPAHELFWLLTSKGYKTYRFLPVFFQRFYPCFESGPAPFEKALLESVSVAKFGDRFDPTAGVLRANPGAQRLREGIADLDPRRLRDPHVAFFQKSNPGHASGDELVCLARCHPDNLIPYIRRQL